MRNQWASDRVVLGSLDLARIRETAFVRLKLGTYPRNQEGTPECSFFVCCIDEWM